MGSNRSKINWSRRRNLSSMELIEINDIPEGILFEVLVRLPVKVLFKFKIVSKQWFSMISDPSFARMYVSRTSLLSHSHNWTLINSFVDKATNPTNKHFHVIKVPQHECSLGTDCPQHRLILPPAQQVDDLNYGIVGVRNGLVLYVGRCDRIYSYYICNLITGQWIALPQLEHALNFVITGFVTQVEDNVLASYRVVRLDSCIGHRSIYKFVVYFSETCKWVDFDIDFHEEICFHAWKEAVVLDKILHQMISGHRIMAYDPYDKPGSIRLISLPSVSIKSYGTRRFNFDRSLLDEHQGHLKYFVVALDERLNEFSGSFIIWILNDYDLGEWCLQHRVSIGDIQYDGGLSYFPLPLSFHPFDPNTVYMVYDQTLFSCDVKTRKWKIEDDSTKNYPLAACLSFVIPPWPVSISPSTFEVNED